jgi:hypothetical protein
MQQTGEKVLPSENKEKAQHRHLVILFLFFAPLFLFI